MIARQERLLDDLRWCLQSPPLVQCDGDNSPWPATRWFQQLEPGLPAGLTLPDDPHHFRLGQHFEKLLAAWIDSREDMHISQANLQIHQGKRTVGEFDLLVDTGQATEHWEAAVKFYLGVGDTRRMDAWYGPNTADRFDLKFKRLVEHQFNLLRNEAARETLTQLDIHIDRVLGFMKGRLFYPWEIFESGNFEFPRPVNPDHEKGWWIPHSEFESNAPSGRRYVPLQKIDWLSPIRSDHEFKSLSLDEMLSILTRPNIQQATHVAIVDNKGNEVSRGFIVTDEWLARIAADSR